MKQVRINEDVAVIYKAIPPLAPSSIELAQEHRWPKPQKPTYTFEAAGGVSVTMDHDEDSVSTPEEKKAWAEYERESAAWQTELMNSIINLIFMEGVDLVATDEIKQEWDERLSMYGHDVTKMSQSAKKLSYLKTFVFNSKEKIGDVMNIVFAETGVSKDDLAAAKKMFLDDVQGDSGGRADGEGK